MTDLLAHCKAAINALSIATETAGANNWLVEFESTSNAWVVADQLLREDNQSFRFFGARILHSKIRRDFRQLDNQSSASLMQSLVSHIIRLSQMPVLEMNICRFLCLAIAALALQLNSTGIVAQILQWLNPILYTQPIILLELLLVLPEECYDRNVLVDHDKRDLFAQQLCHSGIEVFGFLSSLRAASPTLAVQLQLLRCLERWIYNVDMPLSYVAAQPIFVYALEAVSCQQLNEEAVEVVISLVRKFGYGNASSAETALLFPLVVRYISPLSAVWRAQEAEISRLNPNDYDDDTFELCRNICRTFTEVAEAYMSHILAVLSDALSSTEMVSSGSTEDAQQLKAGVSALLQQLLECACFTYNPEVARIPLKFFYDTSVYLLDYRDRCTRDIYNDGHDQNQQQQQQQQQHHYTNDDGNEEDDEGASEPIQIQHRETVEALTGALYTQLVHIALRQMQLPAPVLQGKSAINDEQEVQLREWTDLVSDCCHVLGGDQTLKVVSTVLQTELQLIGAGARVGAPAVTEHSGPAEVAPWARVESCLRSLKEVVRSVDSREATVMPSLIGFLCNQAPGVALPVLVCTSTELVGCCAPWLRFHPETLPALWAVLVRHMEIPHCSRVACVSITKFLQLSRHVSGLPVMDLHRTLLAMRVAGTLSTDSDNTLLEGICEAISVGPDTDPVALRAGFHTVIQPICASLSARLQCEPGAADARAVMADIHRLTTAVQFTSVDSHTRGPLTTVNAHPVIEVFPLLQPIMTRAMEIVQSESVCEKVCRFYKYLIRASTLARDENGVKVVHPAGFILYLDSMTSHLQQLLTDKFYACFLYCGSILFSEFGPVLNRSTHSHIQSQSSQPSQQMDLAAIEHTSTVLFGMLGGFSDLFFAQMKSLSDFEARPDVVEEFFYTHARVLSHCPQRFVAFSFNDFGVIDRQQLLLQQHQSLELSPRISNIFQAALAGLEVKHKDAQKGIMNFVQKLVTTCRSLLNSTTAIARTVQGETVEQRVLAERVRIFHGLVTQHMSGPLIIRLFRGLAGGADTTEIHSLDEEHGSVLDVLWSLHQLLDSQTFKAHVSESLVALPRKAQDIASNVLHFPESLVISVDTRSGASSSVRERQFCSLIREFHRKCTAAAAPINSDGNGDETMKR